MKSNTIFAALILLCVASAAAAQSSQSTSIQPSNAKTSNVPIPLVAEYPPYRVMASPVPGAHELPNPKMTYKLVFDIAKAAPTASAVNPGLVTVARMVNTLASYGVPAGHRKIVVVFHREGTPAVLKNGEYKNRNEGQDNPNIELMESMKKAGVDFRVCGQSVLSQKIDPNDIMPIVQLDLWAEVTMSNLMMLGYAHLVAG